MRRTLAPGIAALAASLALTACGADDSTTVGADDHNDPDVMFAQMMIPHHAQAVEMSDLVLAKDDVGDDVAALAEQIKAAQQPEIEQMTVWLDTWGEDLPEMGGMGEAMNGMLSQEEVDAIGTATATEAALLYLGSMKAHHEGAIEMAEAELADGSNPEALALAETIITTQRAEIAEIEDLLETASS
jgi:uncharacterized protein (DUF305 family)